MKVRPLEHRWLADHATLPVVKGNGGGVEAKVSGNMAYSVETTCTMSNQWVSILRCYVFVNYFWHSASEPKVYGSPERAAREGEEHLRQDLAWFLLQTDRKFPIPWQTQRALAELREERSYEGALPLDDEAAIKSVIDRRMNYF